MEAEEFKLKGSAGLGSGHWHVPVVDGSSWLVDAPLKSAALGVLHSFEL